MLMFVSFYKFGKFKQYQRFFPDDKAKIKHRQKLTRSGCRNINYSFAFN